MLFCLQPRLPEKHKGLDKAEKQIREIAALIDLWWVKESIAHFSPDAEKADWLLYFFLPVVYWQIQLQRTSSEPLRYAYETAYVRRLSAC